MKFTKKKTSGFYSKSSRNRQDSSREIALLKAEISEYKRVQGIINNLLHELRPFNRDFKTNLQNLADSFREIDENETFNDLMARASLLSILMLTYEFELNPQKYLGQSGSNFDIFKKVEKIGKLFYKANAKRNIKIYYDHCEAGFESSPVLEIALYNIIQNAVKYCPDGNNIEVKYTFDGKTLVADFCNLAIVPDKDEIDKILEKGYRSRNIESKVGGQGIGLYTVNRICTGLGIKMKVMIGDESTTIDREVYHMFTIRLTIDNCYRINTSRFRKHTR